MPKTLPLNKHVTKKRGNNYGKVVDYKHKRWARWGKVEGGGGMELRWRVHGQQDKVGQFD